MGEPRSHRRDRADHADHPDDDRRQDRRFAFASEGLLAQWQAGGRLGTRLGPGASGHNRNGSRLEAPPSPIAATPRPVQNKRAISQRR
jgi:hypothetical protein